MKTKLILLSLLLPLSTACGGGVPIVIRIDEAKIDISLDDTVGALEESLGSQGLLPMGATTIPERWPDSFPDVKMSERILAPPVRIDLTPDDPSSPEAEKYKDVNKYADAIRRIEINSLVMRYEVNDSNMEFPAFEFFLADDPDADENDRFAWYKMGEVPPAAAGFVGDLDFEFARGGESFFNSQLGDDERALALRAGGTLEFDTEKNPLRPRGNVTLRLIMQVTFYVEPDTLFGTLN